MLSAVLAASGVGVGPAAPVARAAGAVPPPSATCVTGPGAPPAGRARVVPGPLRRVEQCGSGAPAASGGAATRAAGPRAAAAAADDVRTLHSRPGATKVVHLDLDGATLSATAWNTAVGSDPVAAAPYDTDGDPSTLSRDEQSQVREIWGEVADKLAPFDVDVTTEQPDDAALRSQTPDDGTYGLTVLLTSTNEVATWCGRCGDTAFIGVLGDDRQEVRDSYGTAWVFVDLMRNAHDVGLAAARAVGNMAGLQPRGRTLGDLVEPSYGGTRLWAPITGLGYDSALTTWSAGEYAGATPAGQDDLAVLSGLGVVGDDLPADAVGARDLGTLSAGTGSPPVVGAGSIGATDDVDGFLVTLAGDATITAAPLTDTSMLDVGLTVRDAGTGAVIATAAPPTVLAAAWVATGLGATVDVPVPARTTRRVLVQVSGTGSGGDPVTGGGYSSYSSLGAYRVRISPQAAPDAFRVERSGPLRVAPGATLADAVLAFSGGTLPYRMGAIEVPDPLAFDPYASYLYGVAPSTPGSYPLRLVASDGAGATRVITSSLLVADPVPPPVPAPLALSTRSLPAAVAARPYRARLSATGGTAPLSWRLLGGPRGARLTATDDPHVRLLTVPAPAAAGRRPRTVVVTVRVTDAVGDQATRRWPLVVRPR